MKLDITFSGNKKDRVLKGERLERHCSESIAGKGHKEEMPETEKKSTKEKPN